MFELKSKNRAFSWGLPLQHVLPSGFMRIRYYGFLGSGSAATLDDIRAAIERSLEYFVKEQWVIMNYQFIYDCDSFLSTVKAYCKSKTATFLITENPAGIPPDLEPLIAEFTDFNAKYGESLKALSDHPNIFF